MATAKRKSSAPENETKEQAFIRLAQKRTTKALKAIRSIASLGSRPHTSAHTVQIINALKAGIEKIEYEFGGEAQQKNKSDFGFEG